MTPDDLLPPLASELLAAARNIKPLRPNPNEHAYYTPKNASYVADVIADWKATDYRPVRISCHQLGITAGTLYQKIYHGVRWLAFNSTDERAREFFEDLRVRLQVKIHQGAVELYRMRSRPLLEVVIDQKFLDHQTNLLAWLSDDPPPRAKWPLKKTEFRLTDEQVQWFKAKLAELHAQGLDYMAVIEPERVVFVRVPHMVKLNTPPADV